MLSREDKALIMSLIKMTSKERNAYLQQNTEAFERLENIFKDNRKKQEVEAASDEQIKKAILSSYAAKAYSDEDNYAEREKFYRKKDVHLLTISRLDSLIDSMTDKTSVGEKYTSQNDKPNGYRAYVFSDSHGKKPGMHTRQKLPNINSKNIGDKVGVGNAKYLGIENSEELKKIAKKAAEEGLLESAYDNYFGKLCGINESEFMDDFYAIYGKVDSDYINESLSVELPAERCKTIFNIPLKSLMAYTEREIRDDIKEKDNGKEVKDYQVKSGDSGLTLNYMLAYIRRIGGSSEKDFLDAKIDYFMKIQDNARKEKKDSFKISFASVNSVYRKYLKYKGAR